MKKFNTREEEEAQNAERISVEMERRKKAFDEYRRVAGKGYAGQNTGKGLRKAVKDFEENELEIMRKDIRDLKDMVNLLLDEIALRDKKDEWKPDYAEMSEEEYWEEKMKKLNDN
jgi:mannitol-specific phosphotransferase system IIBC component